LAGEFTGVYPRSSPGGWQLIGRTEARLWDLDRQPPALFVPGTIVRFVEAERESVDLGAGAGADDASASASSAAVGASSSEAGDAVEVVRPGLPQLIEDRGRPGFNSMRVSGAGAAERAALRSGHRLVGDAESAAGRESCGGGAVLRVIGDGVAAVTGAAGSITVTGADGTIHRPRLGEAFAIADGDELELGGTDQGARRYLALRGGIDVDTAPGSASTDSLAGLGPAAPDRGRRLSRHDPRAAPHLVDPHPRSECALPRPGQTVTMTVTLGPREDWFTSAGIETLLSQEW